MFFLWTSNWLFFFSECRGGQHRLPNQRPHIKRPTDPLPHGVLPVGRHLQRQPRRPPGQPDPTAQKTGTHAVCPRPLGERARRLREHVALQDRTVQALRGVRCVQVRGQVPVRPRHAGVAQPGQASEVQDGIVSHVPHGRVLSVRPAVSLRAQPGGGAAAEQGRLDGDDGAEGAAAAPATRRAQPDPVAGQREPAV